MIDLEQAGQILERARKAAIDYYELTGKPLGITGEFGEYVSAKVLGLELADARSPGYDAIDDDGQNPDQGPKHSERQENRRAAARFHPPGP